MDTTTLINSLRRDLSRTAEMGGADVQDAAERLLMALEPAVRLMLMEALSLAAAEIRQAAPGLHVDVRLNGREPEFIVESDLDAGDGSEGWDNDAEDGEGVARITLRLPDALKARAETLAARRGQSLNSWLVAAARAAASDGPRSGRRTGGAGQRLQGWVR